MFVCALAAIGAVGVFWSIVLGAFAKAAVDVALEDDGSDES